MAMQAHQNDGDPIDTTGWAHQIDNANSLEGTMWAHQMGDFKIFGTDHVASYRGMLIL